jgi:DNA-binding MarR family transcriptional regulator
VILTHEGRSQLQRMRTDLAAAESRLLGELSEQQRAQLRDLLARVALTAQRGTLGD